MYTGSMRASNRADWSWSVNPLKNRLTGLAIDLTGASIALAVGDQNSKTTLLTASTTDGRITITAPATSGVFTVLVPASAMSALEAGQYDLGVIVTLSTGRVYQLIKGVLAVNEGVVGR